MEKIKSKRSDLQHYFPEDLDLSFNSRVVQHTQEEIESLAQSIHKDKQVVPVLARRVGGKIQVVAGRGRVTAIQWINKNLRADNPIMVAVKIATMNDEEAYVASIRENEDRKATCSVDHAHQQRELREVYHWTEEQIADLFGKCVSWLSQMKKLVTLSKEEQEEVRSGNLNTSTAFILADLPSEERKEVLAVAKDEDGKVQSEIVKKEVRKRKIAAGKGKTGRSLKEIRDFFDGLIGPGEKESVRGLATKLLRFMSGEINDKEMVDYLNNKDQSFQEVA